MSSFGYTSVGALALLAAGAFSNFGNSASRLIAEQSATATPALTSSSQAGIVSVIDEVADAARRLAVTAKDVRRADDIANEIGAIARRVNAAPDEGLQRYLEASREARTEMFGAWTRNAAATPEPEGPSWAFVEQRWRDWDNSSAVRTTLTDQWGQPYRSRFAAEVPSAIVIREPKWPRGYGDRSLVSHLRDNFQGNAPFRTIATGGWVSDRDMARAFRTLQEAAAHRPTESIFEGIYPRESRPTWSNVMRLVDNGVSEADPRRGIVPMLYDVRRLHELQGAAKLTTDLDRALDLRTSLVKKIDKALAELSDVELSVFNLSHDTQ